MRTSIMKSSPEFAREIPAAVAAMSRAHYALLEANIGLAGLGPADVGYSDRVRVIDAAVLLLSRAKWLYGRATGELADFSGRTESAADLVLAASLFAEVEAMAAVSKAPDSQALRQSADIHAAVSCNGTEIQYFQDVPIVPSICPVVVLVGNSKEMGAQYVRQCVQIFGPFVFSAVARKELDAAHLDVLRQWREMMSRYTPEILEMAEGMSIAAAELGIAVSTDQALSMWTDITAPSTALAPIGVLDAVGGGRMNAYFGADGSTPVEAEDLCSGCAAWGSASADGQLHYAASTDHDCTFQATIIAFPDTGLPFIYTPFSVNGSIPGTGRFGFAGHPGHNLAGLAYVHHGGGGSCGEPPESWGFGVPRGAVTMHVLRYAQNVHEAREMVLNMPTGNVGRLLGTTGGFYADASGGFVLEETQPQLVARENQVDANGETHSVLYATNNVQSSELGEYGRRWGMEYNVEAGWHTLDGGLLATGSPGEMTRRQWSASSESRNRFFYRHLVVQEKNGLLTRFARCFPFLHSSAMNSGGQRNRDLSGVKSWQAPRRIGSTRSFLRAVPQAACIQAVWDLWRTAPSRPTAPAMATFTWTRHPPVGPCN
ncbi:hypothetical protein [Ottowia sp. VDI28]|uniref:hypothetical protein n=1 Tax=Ottowia sp. VDI28 TaxID=3133968 RepID=UPI003C2F3058